MLAHLARWLRAAGYDAAAVGPGASDAAVLQRARREGRIVLTCDRGLSARGVTVIHLPMVELDRLAPILTERLGIDWLYAPFSRCLVDNTPLRPATREEIARLPDPARRRPGPFNACPACGRLYWPGSHVRRMQARLAAFHRGGGGAGSGVGGSHADGAVRKGQGPYEA